MYVWTLLPAGGLASFCLVFGVRAGLPACVCPSVRLSSSLLTARPRRRQRGFRPEAVSRQRRSATRELGPRRPDWLSTYDPCFFFAYILIIKSQLKYPGASWGVLNENASYIDYQQYGCEVPSTCAPACPMWKHRQPCPLLAAFVFSLLRLPRLPACLCITYLRVYALVRGVIGRVGNNPAPVLFTGVATYASEKGAEGQSRVGDRVTNQG